MKYPAVNYPELTIKSIDILSKSPELNLDDKTLFEYWNGAWTIIQIETPLRAEQNRPLLLRLRPSLLRPLQDCPGIEEELRLQSKRTPTSKRAGDELVSPIRKILRQSSSHIAAPPAIVLSSDEDGLPESGLPVSPTPSLKKSRRSLDNAYPVDDSQMPVIHSVTRRWPSAYSLAEIEQGFQQIQHRINADPRRVTEKSAFPLVFHAPYIKTTVGRVKKILASTSHHSQTITWGQFIAKVHGKSKALTSDSEPSVSGIKMEECGGNLDLELASSPTGFTSVLENGKTTLILDSGDSDSE